MKHFSFLWILVIILFSCKEGKEELEELLVPIPEFAMDEFYAVNEQIHLVPANKADAYLWDFGNGTTSTEQTPYPLSYSERGVYTIKLTTITSGKKSTVTKQVKIGQYYAYEVQLVRYVSNYALEGGSYEGASEDNADIYLKISAPKENDKQEELYKSDVQYGATKQSLPLTWNVEPIPLVGKFPELSYGFSALIEFYDANTDKKDRLIATTQMGGMGSIQFDFDKEKNEGQYTQVKYIIPGVQTSHIVVKFKMQLP